MTDATRKALIEVNQILHDAGWDRPDEDGEPAPGASLQEAEFTIPMHRDPEISDGATHDPSAWDWLQGELCERFGRYWTQPGTGEAVWKSEQTGRILRDQVRCYVVALPKSRIGELRSVLKNAASSFSVRRIYLSNAGHVEYVQRD